MRMFHWKVQFGRHGPHILGLRLWPFSLALAVWTPSIPDWRVFSLGPDPFA